MYYFMMFMISFIVLMIMLLVSLLFQDPSSMGESNFSNDPFECGFEPISLCIRTPLLILYFILSMAFLIFDVEIILMMPMVGTKLSPLLWLTFWFFMIYIILMGTLMEIFYGSLEWKDFL